MIKTNTTKAHKGQDISIVAAELLARILEWEAQDSEETIVGIQRGLDDFQTGHSRLFQEFAEEQRLLHIRHAAQQTLGESQESDEI